MSCLDRELDKHNETLRIASQFMSKRELQTVRSYIEKNELLISHYDIAKRLWYLSDGEAYSTAALKLASITEKFE